MASKTTHTCDICGKEGKPERAGEWSFRMGNYCVLTSSGVGLVGQPDVCSACAKRAELLIRAAFTALLPPKPKASVV